MRRLLILMVATTLAACGVDGEPTQPPAPDVSAGATITSSGIYPYLGVGFNTGPISIWLGL